MVEDSMSNNDVIMLSATVALTLVKCVTHSGPEVLFKICIAMKFVDDDDDDDDDE